MGRWCKTSGEGSRNHTVAQYVAARERGELTPLRAKRRKILVDPYREKVQEWVGRSVTWQDIREFAPRAECQIGGRFGIARTVGNEQLPISGSALQDGPKPAAARIRTERAT